ncbi:MAG: MBL fold metallo-hydrolase [Phycisphaeraceae bacterium]|nr:MBL fold metallo-hydrolase [Phycisphaeraceae bacterium]
MIKYQQLLPSLYRFEDTCHVYVICEQDSAIAIDFGSGQWMDQARGLGLPPITDVYLTHHHADQCSGLVSHGKRRFKVHAPKGTEAFLKPHHVATFWKSRNSAGIPASYHVLPNGVTGITFDMFAGSDQFWGTRRIRFMPAPGHGGVHSLNILMDHQGKQVIFCGDSAHAGATLYQPYCLEWDHWTDSGAQGALEAVTRLLDVKIDLLCPSHGPVIDQKQRPLLRQLQSKLHKFIRSKGSICAGEPDRYLEPSLMPCGARQLSEHLYQFGDNGYLLVGENNEALLIDPFSRDMPALEKLLDNLGDLRITAATATHCHADHIDAMPAVKKKHQLTMWLHPLVAHAVANMHELDIPWKVTKPIYPDQMQPNKGYWKWNRYRFKVAHFPGQTWWHCGLMTEIDGQKILFAGDSFQPASRWKGTGGYCSMNGARFKQGFEKSAQLVLDWKPNILACGHGTYYRFAPSQFKKIIQWSRQTDKAIKALCPTKILKRDYDLHHFKI